MSYEQQGRIDCAWADRQRRPLERFGPRFKRLRCSVQVRYNQAPVFATVERDGPETVLVRFDHPLTAVHPDKRWSFTVATSCWEEDGSSERAARRRAGRKGHPRCLASHARRGKQMSSTDNNRLCSGSKSCGNRRKRTAQTGGEHRRSLSLAAGRSGAFRRTCWPGRVWAGFELQTATWWSRGGLQRQVLFDETDAAANVPKAEAARHGVCARSIHPYQSNRWLSM